MILNISCTFDKNENFTGNDVHIFEDTPVWEMAKCIDENDTNTLKKLILKDGKKNINYQEKRWGFTLLHWSIYSYHFDGFKILIDNGADINIKDNDSAIAITRATSNWEDSRFLKLLIKVGANVNYEVRNKLSYNSGTPLTEAAYSSLEITKLLVENGADVNYRYQQEDYCANPLNSAMSGGHMDIVKYLIIDCGFDISKPVYNIVFEGDSIQLYVGHLLRKQVFDLDSEDYRIKMEIVRYLKTRGIDYYSYPIPEHFYKQYSKEFLEKY